MRNLTHLLLVVATPVRLDSVLERTLRHGHPCIGRSAETTVLQENTVSRCTRKKWGGLPVALERESGR
jgi:peptidase E